MKKILFINETCGSGSHGKICVSLARDFEKKGYEVKIAYGRNDNVPVDAKRYSIRIGRKCSIYLHALYTRLTDRHGFGSILSTKRFLKWLDKYKPDIIWLHNLHGYYINIGLLFEWIKKHEDIEIKWTLHDCWAFTGHCSHFSFIGCNKWINCCSKCPQTNRYPKSFIDNSAQNYKRKKELFCGIKKMEIYTPSKWLADLVKKSFLKNYTVHVFENPIDSNIFVFRSSDFRDKNGLKDATVLLAVANVWNDRKGLNDLADLSRILVGNMKLVVVGLSKKQQKLFSPGTIFIDHIFNQISLAELYSSADYLINPSYEETFGMTVAEAMLCGCRPIVYQGTASEEVVKKGAGFIVAPGAENILNSILNKGE